MGDLNTWVWCGHCGAAAWGKPPHGEGQPCPLTVRKLEEDIRLREEEMRLRTEVAATDNAKTNAERAYWENALKAPSWADLIKKGMR